MQKLSKLGLMLAMAAISTGCAGIEYKFQPSPFYVPFETAGLCNYYRVMGMSSVECGIAPWDASKHHQGIP